VKQFIEISALGGLLAASLVATYAIHFHEGASTTAPAEGVPVYAAAAADLTRVTFESKQATVVLERRSDDRGDHVWVTSTTRTERTPPPPPAPEVDPDDTDAEPPPPPPAPEPVIEETTRAFLGSKQADDLWAAFAPLRASRSLDVAGSDLDLGFDAPYAKLTVERKSGPIALEIGNATYGDRSRYLRNGDRVFLIEKRDLTRIEGSAATLAERRLHPLDPAQVAAVVVERDGQKQRFVNRNADDRAKQFWARAETPDTTDRAASPWLATVGRLSALEYVSDKPADLTKVLTVTFEERAGAP
jgi:hypothetical protein